MKKIYNSNRILFHTAGGDLIIPKSIKTIFDKYFDSSLDLRVQAFYLLGFTGIAAGVFTGLSAVLAGMNGWHIALNFLPSAAAFLLVRVTWRYKCYRRSFLLTVIVVFMLIFPGLFFTGGGYRSGMPCFFVFALIFTALMLEKRTRAAALVGEFALYTACVLIAYYFPGTITGHFTQWHYAMDVLVGVVIGGSLLLSVVLLYIRIYDNRQRQLEELDRLKTEFYQDMHHEMKTPLHIISTDIQNAEDMLNFDIDTIIIQNKLESAEREIIRLARLIEYVIDHNAAQTKRRQMEPIDFAALLRSKAGVFRALVERDGNTLSIEIGDGLPELTGNADTLSQVIFNLMYNAHRHTKDGSITVSLTQTGDVLETVIRDTGEGIAQDLLPHIFERGVSASGTGYGLTICKAIVEMHGGNISITSEPGKGTAATFTLPVTADSEREEAP